MKQVRGRAGARKTRKIKVPQAPPSYELEPLNPWLMCGPDTTVTELWKVWERRDGKWHMVFHQGTPSNSEIGR